MNFTKVYAVYPGKVTRERGEGQTLSFFFHPPFTPVPEMGIGGTVCLTLDKKNRSFLGSLAGTIGFFNAPLSPRRR